MKGQTLRPGEPPGRVPERHCHPPQQIGGRKRWNFKFAEFDCVRSVGGALSGEETGAARGRSGCSSAGNIALKVEFPRNAIGEERGFRTSQVEVGTDADQALGLIIVLKQLRNF